MKYINFTRVYYIFSILLDRDANSFHEVNKIMIITVRLLYYTLLMPSIFATVYDNFKGCQNEFLKLMSDLESSQTAWMCKLVSGLETIRPKA